MGRVLGKLDVENIQSMSLTDRINFLNLTNRDVIRVIEEAFKDFKFQFNIVFFGSNCCTFEVNISFLTDFDLLIIIDDDNKDVLFYNEIKRDVMRKLLEINSLHFYGLMKFDVNFARLRGCCVGSSLFGLGMKSHFSLVLRSYPEKIIVKKYLDRAVFRDYFEDVLSYIRQKMRKVDKFEVDFENIMLSRSLDLINDDLNTATCDMLEEIIFTPVRVLRKFLNYLFEDGLGSDSKSFVVHSFDILINNLKEAGLFEDYLVHKKGEVYILDDSLILSDGNSVYGRLRNFYDIKFIKSESCSEDVFDFYRELIKNNWIKFADFLAYMEEFILILKDEIDNRRISFNANAFKDVTRVAERKDIFTVNTGNGIEGDVINGRI